MTFLLLAVFFLSKNGNLLGFARKYLRLREFVPFRLVIRGPVEDFLGDFYGLRQFLVLHAAVKFEVLCEFRDFVKGKLRATGENQFFSKKSRVLRVIADKVHENPGNYALLRVFVVKFVDFRYLFEEIASFIGKSRKIPYYCRPPWKSFDFRPNDFAFREHFCGFGEKCGFSWEIWSFY